MAGLISLPAIHRGLSFHVEGDRRASRIEDAEDEIEEEGRQAEEDAREEEEVKEMNREDEDYWEEISRPTSFIMRNNDDGDGVGMRSDSPDRLSADEIESLPSSGPKKTGIIMDRTISIAEPARSSEDKNVCVEDETPQLSSAYPVRSKRKPFERFSTTLSMTRTNTSRSFASFSSLVTESWDNRHNAGHKGFWAAVWAALIGSKEASEPAGGREGDPDYVPPKYRWTPILSGLLQPFSILLEIPSLTEHWYVRVENNIPVVYQENPIILDVGMALSMACGVIANVALVSRFLERRVYTSTIVTIVALSCHDIINIIAITIFGVIHGVDDGFTYSEAFWLTVCSTAASAFTNATLIYDLIKTKEFRKSGSGLTPKQRSLVIIVMVLLVYIAIGALCFNFLLPEIPFQNALYYTVVSIETIGFGDISPSTLGAKIFLFFYIPFGILNLAVTVGTARDTIVESWNTAYRRRRHEVLIRHRVRKQQRAEEAVRRQAIERQLALIGAPTYVTKRGGGVRGGAKTLKLNTRALSLSQLQAAEIEADMENASKQASAPGGETVPPLGVDATAEEQHQRALADAKRLQEELTNQSLLSEEGYREFQERISKEEKMENLIKFGFAFSLFIVFWIVGATVFSKAEEWDYFTAFYFCFVAFTTIGYGDFYPQSPAGRSFFIIWAIFGVATVTLLIAVLTEAYASRYKSALVQKGVKRTMAAIRDHRDAMHRGGEEHREHDREKIERLPYELIGIMKTWHKYVAASKHGALDGVDSEGAKAILDKLMDEQGMTEQEKKELSADSESRKMLFWNGYERIVHDLIGVAESSIKHHERSSRSRQVLHDLSKSSVSRPVRITADQILVRHRYEATSPLKRSCSKASRLGTVGEGGWSSQPDLHDLQGSELAASSKGEGSSWDLESGSLKGILHRRLSG